jgi:hypothetical protein
MNALATNAPGSLESALADCAATLRRVSEYRLPPAVDQRLAYLAENKETLTPAEREELLALVEFAEGRTIEKLEATAVLRRLAAEFPRLATV